MAKVTGHNDDSLLNSLVLFTRLYHKPFTKDSLMEGMPTHGEHGSAELFSKNSSKSLFSRVAQRAGLKSTLIKRDVSDMLKLHLPAILILSNDNTCIIEDFNDDNTQAKVIYPGSGEDNGIADWVQVKDLEEESLGYAFLLKKEFEYKEANSRTLKIKQKHWFWDTLKLSKGAYTDVLWASFIINLFVLATPLFTMNVYDRVIPNNAQETLMVFTIGIVVVYLLDFALKLLRAYFL